MKSLNEKLILKTDYVDAAGNIRAHCEYSPFGEIVAQSGDMADTFTHRFSTKPFDAETGLVMYQFRPYAPGLGRWMSRDPIEERGEVNLYGFLRNNPVKKIDELGLRECECSQEQIWITLGNKMREASQLSLAHPVIVDENHDRRISKIPAFVLYHREYGGYICCNKKNGEVSSTGPYPGSWRITRNDDAVFYSDNPVLLAQFGGTPTTGNITTAEKTQCPEGTTTVMFYHSHPPNALNLSASDMGFSRSLGAPIAGGGAGANYYWFYSPYYGRILVEY